MYIRGEVFADLGAGVPKVKTQRTCPSIKMVIEPRTYNIGRYRKGRVEIETTELLASFLMTFQGGTERIQALEYRDVPCSTCAVTLVLGSTAKFVPVDNSLSFTSALPNPPLVLPRVFFFLYSSFWWAIIVPRDLDSAVPGPACSFRPVATRLARHGGWPDLLESPRWELQRFCELIVRGCSRSPHC